MPNGLTGVMGGVAAVFWAFIGFDAISTTAEECENPQRDLPKGIFSALIICTVLYVAISFVLTGIVNYKELNVGDPLAYIFKERLPWLSSIIAFSAIFRDRECVSGLPTRTTPHLDEHGSRRPAAAHFLPHPSEAPDAVLLH